MSLTLFLNGDLGLWALNLVDARAITEVFTDEEVIIRRCRDLGLRVVAPGQKGSPVADENGLSVHYRRIITDSEISRYKAIYNVHPGFLPYGRGYYPVFWAMYERTPAGATIHRINSRLDAGPIVDQKEVVYTEDDTGHDLFLRIRNAEMELLRKYYARIEDGERLPERPQVGLGTYHNKAEFMDLKSCAKLERMSGSEVLRLIRCMTHAGYSGLEYRQGRTLYSYTATKL